MAVLHRICKIAPVCWLYLLSEVGADLLADSLGHAHGSHSSGLSATHHAVSGVAILVQVLGQLGGLPTAGFPNNNHYAVVPAVCSKHN